MGETLGGIIVGFDQQILRTLPPPHELVQKGAPVRGLTGEDGGALAVSFPDDRAERSPDPEDDRAGRGRAEPSEPTEPAAS